MLRRSGRFCNSNNTNWINIDQNVISLWGFSSFMYNYTKCDCAVLTEFKTLLETPSTEDKYIERMWDDYPDVIYNEFSVE